MKKKHAAMICAGVLAFGTTAWIGGKADDDAKDLSSFNEDTTSDVDEIVEEYPIVTTSRTYASQKERFELDETFEYHDIAFSVYSKWKEIDDTVMMGTEGFFCPKADGFIMLEFDSYDDSSVCESMLEFHNNTYRKISNSAPRVTTISDVDISVYNWKTSGKAYEKIYIFSHNNSVYKIDFYCDDEHYENCSMFQNADDMINSMVFNNLQTTNTQTEPSTTTEVQVTTQVTEAPTDAPTEKQTYTVILNTSTMCYHTKKCRAAKKIDPENYAEMEVYDYSEVENMGYDACGICK